MSKEDISFEAYILQEMSDGTYRAIVHPRGEEPRIVIPEEYNGIPITKISIGEYIHEPIHTICVSKNVKEFKNDNGLHQYNQPYFVEISPENRWLCADEKAVFSKDRTILYAFTARKDESYTVPNEVKIIYDYAFFATGVLKELTFPDELDEIKFMAFYFCNVRDWKLPKKIKRIESCGLAGISHAQTFILPEDVEEIDSDAFMASQCSSPVYLPDCFSEPELCIPSYQFAPEYIIDENSKTLALIDGVVYTKDMKALLAVSKKSSSVITVPDGVEVIGNQACHMNENIREIILPRSVHTILTDAFSHSKLKKINLEDVRHIGEDAFYECDNLYDTGKIGAEKIDPHAFCDCKSLSSVILTNVKELGRYSFSGIKDDAEISLPEGLETIDSLALNSKFRSLRIPRSASMSDNCIAGCCREIELYDVENSVIYKKDPEINNFSRGCLVKVLSPDNDEIKYAAKIFEAEETDAVKDSREYINSLFGGDQFFDLQKYDEYFRTVYNRNHILSKYEAAYYRMKYPAEITDYTREMYMTYLEVCSAEIVWYILNKRNVTVEEIADFPYLYAVEEKYLIDTIAHSVENGLTEITSFLMNYKNEHFPTHKSTEEANE